MTSAAELHARGRAAVLEGRVVADVPPGAGSRRWGLSVIFRPDAATAARMEEVTLELAELAGPRHWRTGGRSTSHVTVCSLEPYRDLTEGDPGVRRYAEVMARVAGAARPVDMSLQGLLVSPGGVLARGLPADDAAQDLRSALIGSIGEDFEGSYRGTTWWASLLHLTGPAEQPRDLVNRVEGARDLHLGRFTATSLQLVRYEHRSVSGLPLTVPVPLAEAALGASEDVRRGA